MDRQQQLEEVGRILGLPRKKRWLAARDFALAINPHARVEHQAVIQDVKKVRSSLKNKFAAGQEGLRWGLRFPETIWATIKMFDPEFDRFDRDRPAVEQKRELKKLIEAFPEYKVPEKF